MTRRGEELERGFRELLARFDELARASGDRPRLFLIGAGTLLLEGLISRATQDLDFICDEGGERFENQILQTGLHSHRVPGGLVSMPEGWRERSREAREFGTKHVRVFLPDIHDRLVDKLSRGLATDWQDITAVLDSAPAGFSGRVLSERAAALLRRPTSTVFDEKRFRERFDGLRKLAAERGIDVPSVEA